MAGHDEAGRTGTPNQTPTGAAGELHQQAGNGHPEMTTNQGVPVSDNQNTLKSHQRGSALLEDFAFREKVMHFDHERIPERVVHARGTAAHGHFELTESLEPYTTARIFTEVGERTPVFCRLSTVVGNKGSMDTPRDARGFATKFYTKDGNYDLVANNMPVFFIQDGIKFPDLVHAIKPEPDRGFPQATGAHDTFWDFISLMPESMHMIMWLMSDRAIPRSLRMMEGFGVHSFRLVNAAGESTFVKFHWRPRLGMQSLIWDEAVKIAGADNDFTRRDLFDSIKSGAGLPAWDLAVQLFTEEEAEQFPFDHLDSSKLIPEELVPLKVIGHMVLDRWVDNFFAETEQVAFCPANIVPGIDFSDDPLLQGRIFSYLDTQLIRLGGPNFQQIPINAPQCPFANHQQDGHMQMGRPKGRVMYEPSSLDADPQTPRATPRGFQSFAARNPEGHKTRLRPESFADHYSQARQFYISQLPIEQAHLASALVFELSKVETVRIREAMVGHLRQIDEDLAERVRRELGIDTMPPAPEAARPTMDLPPSPALSIVANMKPTLEGRTVGILMDDGSDAAAIESISKAAMAEGATVKLVAPRVGGATLSDGTRKQADGQLAGSPSVMFDAVAVVLSADAGLKLSTEAAAVQFAKDAFGHLKAIAFDEGARQLLDMAGIEHDQAVLPAADVGGFIAMAKTRQWERERTLRTLP